MKKLIAISFIFAFAYMAKAQIYTPVLITTPNQTSFYAGSLTSSDYTTNQKNDIKEFWLECYNDRITYKGEATYQYNCHAYAWRVSEGGSKVWINTPDDDNYWEDCSYVEVISQSDATKVSYGGPCYQMWGTCIDTTYTNPCDHSAITTSSLDYFISKWGASPRFLHHKDDCPYSTEDIHYYSILYISGPTNLCANGGEYRVLNAPPGSYVSWSYSNNITSYYGGNTWIALRATSNGEGWVEATINTIGCGNITLPRITVWAGIPTAYNFYTEVNGQEVEYYDVALICPYITSCLDARSEVEEMGTTNYTWHLPSWYSPSGSFGSNGICFNPNGTIGSTITADVTNSCGTGYGVIQIYLGNNGCKGMYQYVISPNPVITELSIEQLTNEEATGREVLQPVEIFDESGVKDSYDNSYTVEIWHEKKEK